MTWGTAPVNSNEDLFPEHNLTRGCGCLPRVEYGNHGMMIVVHEHIN